VKRMSILLGIGLILLSILVSVPGVLLAMHGESHRPRPKSTPTPVSAPTPEPVEVAAPALISPPNGAVVSGEVTFVWSTVPGAACYEWEAGLTTDFDGQSNLRSSCLTDTAYTISLSPGFVEYWPHLYWHVHARDRVASDVTGTYGRWSETWLVTFASP
jgi:hypothetical protein